jgi:hypothetical protein
MIQFKGVLTHWVDDMRTERDAAIYYLSSCEMRQDKIKEEALESQCWNFWDRQIACKASCQEVHMKLWTDLNGKIVHLC